MSLSGLPQFFFSILCILKKNSTQMNLYNELQRVFSVGLEARPGTPSIPIVSGIQ